MILVTTKERILHYIHFKGFSVKCFLDKTKIKRGFLDSDKLKATVSDFFITKIIAIFPDLNLYWLLTGEGDMINKVGDELHEPSEVYGLNYKEMYLETKYALDIQKKYIVILENKLKILGED